MRKKEYIVFVHTSARKPEGRNYALYATGIYADAQGKHLLHADVVRVSDQSENIYIRAIQCYANALEALYKHQKELTDDGVTNAFLVLNSKVIKQWVKFGPPKRYKDIFDRIHQLYGFGGAKEIQLTVGLASDTVANKAYGFCKDEYAKDQE